MISDRHITGFMHSKGATIVMYSLLCAAAVTALIMGKAPVLQDCLGMCSDCIIGIHPQTASAVASLAAIGLAAIGWVLYINRAFNVLRSLTWLVATMFLSMEVAQPMLADSFYSGTLLLLSAVVMTGILFSSFGETASQRSIFLIFLLLSALSLFNLAFIFYWPVMILGCMQMRVFSLRTILAALMGTVTPLWILLGFGIVAVDELRFPALSFNFRQFLEPGMIETGVSVAFTILTGFFFAAANLLKILSYNSRTRAYNGFITIMLLFTALFAVANIGNILFYLPLLNLLTAYQVGHFFTYRRHQRSYIAILGLMACYFGLYFWAILI